MPSLRQLIANHRLCLIVDTCSTRSEAALWGSINHESQKHGPSAIPALAETMVEGEASAALPLAVSHVLAAAGGLRIKDLDAVAFCDGPGSVLGVRLAAATLRAWRAAHPTLALYAFHSLPLLAVAAANTTGATIIADARRDTWHVVRPDAPHTVLRLPTGELAACDALASPDNFRRWSALPAGMEPSAVPYSAAALLAAAPDEPFFETADQPDAFVHEQPSYVAWIPRVHQAPSSAAAR